MAGERWVFTQSQLTDTPSRKCNVDADKEFNYRQQAANLIQDMGQRLQVTQLCINTAIVYMHRFYMFHSFTKFYRNNIAAACLFLAAKVEEQPRKLEHVLRMLHMCVLRDASSLDTKSDAYQEQVQDLISNENVLLQTLGFEITVDHPHTHIVRTSHLVNASKDLAQTSYFLATNSLHLTTMCLKYHPTVVACVCIHLACKWSGLKIPKSSEDREWFYYTDPKVTIEILEELTQEFLEILDKCPSRLKRKIMTVKHQAASTDGDSGRPNIPPVTASTSGISVDMSTVTGTPIKSSTDTPHAHTNHDRKDTSAGGSKGIPVHPNMRRVRTEPSLTPKEYMERRERERAERQRIEHEREKLAASRGRHHHKVEVTEPGRVTVVDQSRVVDVPHRMKVEKETAPLVRVEKDTAPRLKMETAPRINEKEAASRMNVEKETTPRVNVEKETAPRLKMETAPRIKVEKEAASRMNVEKESVPRIKVEKETTHRVNVEKETAPRVNVEKETAPRVNVEKETAPRVNVEKETAPRIKAEKETMPRVNVEKESVPRVKVEKETVPWVNVEKETVPSAATDSQTRAPKTDAAPSKGDGTRARTKMEMSSSSRVAATSLVDGIGKANDVTAVVEMDIDKAIAATIGKHDRSIGVEPPTLSDVANGGGGGGVKVVDKVVAPVSAPLEGRSRSRRSSGRTSRSAAKAKRDSGVSRAVEPPLPPPAPTTIMLPPGADESTEVVEMEMSPEVSVDSPPPPPALDVTAVVPSPLKLKLDLKGGGGGKKPEPTTPQQDSKELKVKIRGMKTSPMKKPELKLKLNLKSVSSAVAVDDLEPGEITPTPASATAALATPIKLVLSKDHTSGHYSSGRHHRHHKHHRSHRKSSHHRHRHEREDGSSSSSRKRAHSPGHHQGAKRPTEDTESRRQLTAAAPLLSSNGGAHQVVTPTKNTLQDVQRQIGQLIAQKQVQLSRHGGVGTPDTEHPPPLPPPPPSLLPHNFPPLPPPPPPPL